MVGNPLIVGKRAVKPATGGQRQDSKHEQTPALQHGVFRAHSPRCTVASTLPTFTSPSGVAGQRAVRCCMSYHDVVRWCGVGAAALGCDCRWWYLVPVRHARRLALAACSSHTRAHRTQATMACHPSSCLQSWHLSQSEWKCTRWREQSQRHVHAAQAQLCSLCYNYTTQRTCTLDPVSVSASTAVGTAAAIAPTSSATHTIAFQTRTILNTC